MTGHLLEVQDLRVRYGPVSAVRRLDALVATGEVVFLLGANGAGKSSALKAIAGTVPFEGEIRLAGVPMPRSGKRSAAAVGVSLVPEGRGTVTELTVEENLRLGAFLRSGPEVNADLDRWLTFFPAIARRRRVRAGSLSGGEQQMLAVARALMARPKLLLLDEPSMGLAPAVAQELFQKLNALRDEADITMVVVEQNLRFLAELGSRAIVMSLGEAVMTLEGDALRVEDLWKQIAEHV